MPVITIDDEVWAWLKGHARPLEDTPNSVLRRLAGLDDCGAGSKSRESERPVDGRSPRSPQRRIYGRDLNQQWEVGARHALYHKDGNYYEHLRDFPGALFDAYGYVVFETEHAYLTSPYLQRGEQLHVPGGISSLPGYVRKR